MNNETNKIIIRWISNQYISTFINLGVIIFFCIIFMTYFPRLTDAIVESSKELNKLNVLIESQNANFIQVQTKLDVLESKIGGTYHECREIQDLLKKNYKIY